MYVRGYTWSFAEVTSGMASTGTLAACHQLFHVYLLLALFTSVPTTFPGTLNEDVRLQRFAGSRGRAKTDWITSLLPGEVHGGI